MFLLPDLLCGCEIDVLVADEGGGIQPCMVIFVEDEGCGRVLIVEPEESSEEAETLDTTDETIERSTATARQQAYFQWNLRRHSHSCQRGYPDQASVLESTQSRHNADIYGCEITEHIDAKKGLVAWYLAS